MSRSRVPRFSNRWIRPVLGVTAIITALIASLAALMPSASAGGSWLDPVQERYEPGDEVTLVGYIGVSEAGFERQGPFLATIIALDDDYVPLPDAEEMAVGQLEAEATGDGGYLALRVSITFTLPDEAPPAVYRLGYCNEGCADLLGDLIGAIFHVGVSPTAPVTREWALNDPEIANLAPEAIIAGPGYTITAAELWAGVEPKPAQPRPAANASPTVVPRPTRAPSPTPAEGASTTDESVSETRPAHLGVQHVAGDDLAVDKAAVDEAAIGGQAPSDSGGTSFSAGLAPVAGGLLVVGGAATAIWSRRSSRRNSEPTG